ncbi:MAG TPA: helix-turn-helix domain-containing protein [Solirubrobacteraceae bacterium]|jgi:DNA-binding HxlR family transcriptional regulator
MATSRTYGEACRFAHALDLIGERWALLVVRELLLGPKRFTDLHAGLPHASPNVLSQRLRELERTGVVRRRRLGPPAGSRVYELTEWGHELGPIVTQLGRWGDRSPFPPQHIEIGTDAAVLALRALFDPDAAIGVDAIYALHVGEDRFAVAIASGELMLTRGEAPEPEATIKTTPGTLAMLVSHHLPLGEALRSGEATIVGSRPAVARLLELFAPAEPAPAPVLDAV